jgi:glutamate-1-semialdehyde 2,1-aminomutase
VDGNRSIDYVLGMGPNILGHAPAPVIRAVGESLALGQLFGAQHESEVTLAELVCACVPCAELVRFGLSGSEMVQAALRVARAATARAKVVKFEGDYHGWYDSILASLAPPLDAAGPADAPIPHLPSAGQSPNAAADLVVLPWNNLPALEAYLAAHGRETAAIITEPIFCNTGSIPPLPGYLAGLRSLCDRHSVVLIFDEVITGFRVALGGAQALYGVTPDLAVFAKAIGGGFPLAALAGQHRYMELIASGEVVHSGTYNGNLVGTAAGIATLRTLMADDGQAYRAMGARGERLMAGLREAATEAEVPLTVMGVGAVFNTAFPADAAGEPITDYRSYARTDRARQARFVASLRERGLRVTGRGTWFLSTAHTDEVIDATLAAAEVALRQLQP